MPNTETIDRLYLEWSQFTKARNSRELDAFTALAWALDVMGIYEARIKTLDPEGWEKLLDRGARQEAFSKARAARDALAFR